ncbi:uncharacterized protein Aud_004385 [Aspergillus udagawae]|uniref:Uncharacterized protein n=1 Tax=Aspergillus udagawae TaxID=91492 RepID=A0A8E0QRB9_9EURO|nr:uncharacterized protein Aud_004385 [Aspergillus udagawae]GIC87994.1 hypothetical protein Aud_004385 [Aspergillus udagawae]
MAAPMDISARTAASATSLVPAATALPDLLEEQVAPFAQLYRIRDSYPAGTGARCGWIQDEFDNSAEEFEYRCCEGAYPYQLLSAGDQMESMVLRFRACTGAVIADMETSTPSREAQLRMIMGKQYYASSDWATISIGGTNVGFGQIAYYCLHWCNKDGCALAMANAATKVPVRRFPQAIFKLYDNIFLDALPRGLRQTAAYSSLLQCL